jgi:DNA adenine methylase
MREEGTPSKRVSDPRDARAWLCAHGHTDVAARIDEVHARWTKLGKRTRRNWWDVLAGDRHGRPRRVAGVIFPVLAEAQKRQRRSMTANPPDPNGSTEPGPRAAADPAPVGRGRVASAGDPSRPDGHVGEARPFLKWAGGKRQLLGEIVARLPRDIGTFHEPFVGGGAVFFALRPRAAILCDRNERLIRAYRGVRDRVPEVIEILAACRNEKRFFLEMRKKSIDECSDAEVAAWLIYLNKTGFNGLYRVNSRNEFNVPFADNQGANFCDSDNLRACAAALAPADLKCEDFAAVLDRARPGDVVYFDPPYVPLSGTSSFTSYTSDGFGSKDQERLRDVALELRNRGIFVLLSNSSAPLVRRLYGLPFDCIEVAAARSVNSDPKGRGRITELLIK